MAGLTVGELLLRVERCRGVDSVAALSGTVPAYYREVYDVLSPTKASKITKSVWTKCFKTSGLPQTVLTQVAIARSSGVADRVVVLLGVGGV